MIDQSEHRMRSCFNYFKQTCTKGKGMHKFYFYDFHLYYVTGSQQHTITKCHHIPIQTNILNKNGKVINKVLKLKISLYQFNKLLCIYNMYLCTRLAIVNLKPAICMRSYDDR